MRAVFSFALVLLAQSVSCGTLEAQTGSPVALERARILIAGSEHEKAAAVLEEAIETASPSDKPALVGLLRQSYRSLIDQAEAAGKSRQAAEYRENLAILDQTPIASGGKPQENASQREVRVATPPAGSSDSSPPAQLPRRSDLQRLPRSSTNPDQDLFKEPQAQANSGHLPALEGPGTPGTTRPGTPRDSGASTPGPGELAPDTTAGPLAVSDSAQALATTPGPGNAVPTPADSTLASGAALGTPGFLPANPVATVSDVERADRLFTDKKYGLAGPIYAMLAAKNQLPAERKQVWAYCRWVAVVDRINAFPRTDREWDQIEQEIRSIQRLTPGSWYGDYLSRVIEARRTGRSSARGRLVVRGSAPDESSSPAQPGVTEDSRSRSAAFQPAPAGNAGERQPLGLPTATAPVDAGKEQSVAPSSTTENPAATAPQTWHVRDTANFRVYYTDGALAEKAAEAAEAVRARQAERWGSTAKGSQWSPRCDIYLYSSPKVFARMTGQPEASPGFSTMSMNSGRIIARRVNLRADHPQMLSAILPHEVTHVVLADLFTRQQIPRWADEGMAVLAEPIAEQISRASELIGPLQDGRVFRLSELMATDYPSADAWSLYYAQSVSLTQFLVEQGTPQQFVSFVRTAQHKGVESALREVYGIGGFPDLENRWQNFARRQIAAVTASSRGPSSELESTPHR
ncbi:MAG TPA: hypothetical protein VJY33_08380 [Isosphaeraceae bacterium]|nr:hypothetical protein [Isosphaeraceae bacterium]